MPPPAKAEISRMRRDEIAVMCKRRGLTLPENHFEQLCATAPYVEAMVGHLGRSWEFGDEAVECVPVRGLGCPRIDERDLYVGKMADVAGGQCGAGRQSDAGDHGVAYLPRPADSLSVRGQSRGGAGSAGVKRNHPALDKGFQEPLKISRKAIPASSCQENFDPGSNLEDGD